jgi:hypothetical protein
LGFGWVDLGFYRRYLALFGFKLALFGIGFFKKSNKDGQSLALISRKNIFTGGKQRERRIDRGDAEAERIFNREIRGIRERRK